MAQRSLDEARVSIRIQLAALWGSVMFLYLCADYFGLYVPGALQSMIAGQMRPLGPTTQGLLVGTSLMMAIPSLMVFLSVGVRARISRGLNVGFGPLYTGIILMTMWGWAFYRIYGVLEITFTLLIVWTAWRWPRAGEVGIDEGQMSHPIYGR
ncbi:MAG: DUF6326 family protein [Thermoanaerobaculia bacterium]